MDYPNPPADKQHFSLAHFSAVAVCAILLLFFAWMKSDFHFSFHNSSDAGQHVLTYEEAKAQVLAEEGILPNSNVAAADSQSADLAMIDPSLANGSVLGASTGTDLSVLPPTDQILTPEVLGLVKVNQLVNTGAALVQTYKDDIDAIEEADGVTGIVADMTSQDKAVLTSVASRIDQLIKDLLQVQVPSDLVEYHKVKLIYYSDMRQLALGYIGGDGAPDPQQVGMELLSLNEYFANKKSQIQTTYDVQF